MNRVYPFPSLGEKKLIRFHITLSKNIYIKFSINITMYLQYFGIFLYMRIRCLVKNIYNIRKENGKKKRMKRENRTID